ncbi:uncharacterized protein LOC106143057 [Amyelois transitella]|uniref:uncharacterized protein LOC106143057 n=1 Tax=Amyelois transitella TaxID=680683 RepID=UPI00067A8DA1|nr:uncharacterized protein LOC106143057 [Amyelois transitella]
MKAYSVVGNKKKVTMQINASRLKVVGNNCIVRVTCNQGEVEVIGNDCFVEVADNYGNINLVGANGNVSIGKRWKGDKVNLVGPHHLEVAGKKKTVGYEAQLSPMSPFSKDLDDVIESIFTFVMR